MNGSEFSFFLPPLTAHVARIIAERHGWDEETAFERLVESDLYALLEEPKTEVWHYSPLMLAMMFDSECEGHLEFPEVRRWTTASWCSRRTASSTSGRGMESAEGRRSPFSEDSE